MKRGVFNTIRKGNDKAVDNSDISKTQRSSYDEITNQGNANHSFVSAVLHILNSLHKASQLGFLCRNTGDVT
jgi:hypothetical protein